MKKNNESQITLFQSEDGKTKLQVRIEDEAVWLSQRLIADLYQVSVPTVNEHLAGIYEEGELAPEATIRKFRIVQREGSRAVERLVDHYNLEAILAVGYRVRSIRGTQFRKWATSQLLETLELLNGSFIKRSPTFMLPASIMILNLKLPKDFSLLFKTSFTGPISSRNFHNHQVSFVPKRQVMK